MFKKYFGITLLMFLMILIIGCQSEINSTPGLVEKDTTPTSTLEADKGGVRGRLLSNQTNEPLGKIGIRLAEVVRQGEEAAFVLDTAFSPAAVTDENGDFVIMNVPPMEYLIVVGNVEIYQGYEILQDSSGKPYTYQVKSGEILEIGTLGVNLTFPGQ